MKNILIAVDGSDHSNTALEVGAALARQHDANVVVAHVITREKPSDAAMHAMEVEFSREFENRTNLWFAEAPTLPGPQYASTLLSNQGEIARVVNSIMGEKILSAAKVYLQEHGVDGPKSILCEGSPAEKILESAQDHQSDCIVMGCRGVSKLKGLLMGSVSQTVAHQADCTVILAK